MQYILTEQEYTELKKSETSFDEFDISDVKPIIGANLKKSARINFIKGGKNISLTISKEVVDVLNRIVNT